MLETYRKNGKEFTAYMDKTMFKEAWDTLSKNEKAKREVKPLNPEKFIQIKLHGLQSDYLIDLPKGTKCHKQNHSSSSVKYRCWVTRTNIIDISFMSSKSKIFDLWNNRKLKPEPVELLREYQKSKNWPQIKKKLTAKQLKFLHQFQVEPFKCRKYKPSFYFKAGGQSCSATVYNYKELNHIGVINMVQHPSGEVITFTASTDRSEFSQPIIHASKIASVTLKQVKKSKIKN